MATSQLRGIIRNLTAARLKEAGPGLTDGHLLESYVRTREPEAFAVLVQRHGPMVWGVCRRLLGHHDAEDAFQATFLVLARKAAAVVPRDLIANWLHGVALQTALKARATTAKRSAREKQVPAMPEPAFEQQQLWDDVRLLLDRELGRLPDKYRAVLILCDLGGKTRKEAARYFHVPEGTVASRLAAARSMLAKRLSRYRLVLSGAALVSLLTQRAAPAQVPLLVTSTTVQAAMRFAAGQASVAGGLSAQAVALAEGVLKTMLLAKLKLTTAVLVVVTVLGLGVAALGQGQRAGNPPGTPTTPTSKAGAKPADKPAQPPAPEKKASAPQTLVIGVVKSVDGGRRSLTVTHRDGEATFQVAEDAQVNIDGKRGELAKLPVGAHVVLSHFSDTDGVRAIQAQGAAVFGSVRTVDADKNTITVRAGQGEKTYAVSPETEITIDGVGGRTLASIPKGANVHALNLCVDQKTAHTINVEGPAHHHVPVKSVDADRRTITFDDKAHPDLAGQTYAVAKDAVIRIDGQPGKPADIPAGAFVSVVMAVYGQTARRLDAEGPQLAECGISAVNIDGKTITFDDKAPAEVAGKTLAVAKNIHIVVDGKTEPLSGLPVGAHANATLSVDRSAVCHVHVQGPTESGVVKGVDAQKNTVVIDDKTFTLAKDANILIDGKTGRLSGLPKGALVDVRLSMDQSVIRQLSAQGPNITGYLKALDGDKSTIKVDAKTYSVAKDATIILDESVSTLASLPEGAHIGLTLSADQRSVRVIHARSP
jgi:RNA polymerase sigma factor (sigma-70 family)